MTPQKIRKKYGITQKELANLSGYSLSTIRHMEYGLTPIKDRHKIIFAEVKKRLDARSV